MKLVICALGLTLACVATVEAKPVPEGVANLVSCGYTQWKKSCKFRKECYYHQYRCLAENPECSAIERKNVCKLHDACSWDGKVCLSSKGTKTKKVSKKLVKQVTCAFTRWKSVCQKTKGCKWVKKWDMCVAAKKECEALTYAEPCKAHGCDWLEGKARCKAFTDAPTAAPTANPTDAPTANPTDAPTDAPTAAPTANPTDAPTANPTDAPTAAPTANPTDAPTATPTVATKTTGAPTVGTFDFTPTEYENTGCNEGSFKATMGNMGDVKEVGTIPPGIEKLYITMTAPGDVDIQVWDWDSDPKQPIVADVTGGLLRSMVQASVDYKGVTFSYSGFSSQPTEWISLNKPTPSTIMMKLQNYGAANQETTVVYKWGPGCTD